MDAKTDDTGSPGARPARGMYRRAHLYVLALFLVVFAGFFRTYFSRLGQAGAWQHLHAATAIGWLSLLVAQSYAITHGRASWHRAMAKLSFVMVPVLVITGLVMVHRMLGRHPLTLGSSWTLRAFADFTSLTYFVIQYAMGIVYRRDVHQHQRFMLATVFALFPPAMGRIIGVDLALRLGPWNMALNHCIGALVVVVLLISDWRRERTVYFAYGLALAFFLFLLASVPMLLHAPDWYGFCLWFGGAGR